MLNRKRGDAGFTLIELMVVLALVGFMLVMAVRAFAGWSADGRVRSTAESLLNALRVTQANAVANNRIAVFALTSATPSVTAAPSTSGSNWYLRLVPLLTDETAANLGLIQSATIARQYSVTLSGSSATGTTSSPICFNSLGQLTTASATALGVSTGCTPPTDGTAITYTVSSTSAVRRFKILVSPGGQMRMCDAAKTLSNSNPDGCP